MLALNASIEAARAGEAGEGFAVAAGEAKSLAGESQQHAAEIEQLVSNIKADIEEGGSMIEMTAESAEKVAETDRIADADEEQATQINEIQNPIRDRQR